VAVTATEPHDAEFTLDAALLAERRAASARRQHTVQLPLVRALGFAILCLIAVLHDWRAGLSLAAPALLWVLLVNVAYPATSWPLLRWAHGRFKRFDASLAFLHLLVGGLALGLMVRKMKRVHLMQETKLEVSRSVDAISRREFARTH